MSALRWATFVSELTVMGASPDCTAKERAVSSVPVLTFSTCMAAPLTLPVSLVKALATFALPRRKGELLPPVALQAVEATPITSAITSASPNTIEAVLPTHAIFGVRARAGDGARDRGGFDRL